MDFSLNEEQRMFCDLFRDFSQAEIAPRAEHVDKTESYPHENIKSIAEQGLLTAALPEKYGGAALDTVGHLMWIEALAGVCMTTAVALHLHGGMVGGTILRSGSDVQREQYLPQLATGERIGAFAWSEPGADADAGCLRAVAIRQGDGYIINGRKAWIGNATAAGLFLVFANTEVGLSAFLVEREWPGVRVGRVEPLMGLRGLGAAAVHLHDVYTPAENLLGGAEGRGLLQATQARDYGRLTIAAIALGAAQQALDLGARFACERVQFNVPIAQKQAIQNYLAESDARIRGLRHLVRYGAWLVDQGLPYAEDAAAARLLGAETARWVSDRMVQVHGGYGYMKEYAIERIYRDCHALDQLEGSPQVQRQVLAQHLFKPYDLRITA